MTQESKVEDVVSALDGIEIEDDAELIDDNSPLHNAASRGHANYLEALLNAGASPNSRDPYGNTLLHLAAMHGTKSEKFCFRLTEMRSVLRTQSALPGSNSFFLHQIGHSKSVLLLLERGARLNARNKYGNTLLHAAAMNGHTEMVLFLLDKGIKLTTKNNAGSTPLHYAGT